jgi:hypothetical protein
MAYIKSAYLGDERSAQNVTDSLSTKIEGGKLKTIANSSLLPMFQVGGKITLSDADEEDIKTEAEKQCGAGNDSQCLDTMQSKLRRSKLEEKEREKQSSAYLVKGRRLTVTYVDTNGEEKTMIVPEGQEIALDGLRELEKPIAPGQLPTFKPTWEFPSLTGTALEAVKITGILLGVFFYVFSVIATYRTLIQAGFTWIGYAGTAAAAFIPYSGYLIMLVFFAGKEYMSIKSKE